MLVALSQRTHEETRYSETRDCLDQEWARLISRLGGMAVPLPNSAADPLALLERLRPDALILTGGADPLPGGGNSSGRNELEDAMLAHAQARGLPVLAICRGMQAVNVRLGGRVERVAHHVAMNHRVTAADGRALMVNSFHDFGIRSAGLAPVLHSLLLGEDGTVEAARHRDLPWTGLMWHPERANPNTLVHEAILAAALRGGPILPAIPG